MTRRYAEGAAVSVESSRGEITGILAKHGVIRMGWFTADVKAMTIADGRDWSRVYDPASKVNAEWKRRWRANVLLLKAKLEFADGLTSTVERELMPYMVLSDGRTLEAVITDGSLPLLAAKNG